MSPKRALMRMARSQGASQLCALAATNVPLLILASGGVVGSCERVGAVLSALTRALVGLRGDVAIDRAGRGGIALGNLDATRLSRLSHWDRHVHDTVGVVSRDVPRIYPVAEDQLTGKATLRSLRDDDLITPVSYTHLRAHETDSYLVCRLLLEK